MQTGDRVSNLHKVLKLFAPAVFLGFGTAAAWSQSLVSDGAPTRVPATGIAILDCDPPSPAPEDSCLVRVPPKQQRGALQRRSLGETDAEFEFVREQHALFPDDLTLSATVLLIDRSPTSGNNGRRATWDFEREQILRLARSLPAEEQVAVYTFDEKLNKIVDFTTNRSSVLDGIAAMELGGLNTRISTSTEEAVDILQRRQDVLLKNVILITDGEEEGDGDTVSVTSAASEAGVTISALGMLWTAPGASSAAAAMDYLQELTKGSLGSVQAVRLRRQAEAREAVGRFIGDINSSIGASGLIVPKGTPAPAEIIVEMRVPVTGDETSFRSEEVRATFTPVAAPADPEPDVVPDDPPKEGLLFGFPALYVYGAIAAAVLALLVLLVLLLRRSSGPSADQGIDLDAGDLDELDLEEGAKTEMARPAPAAASAPPIAFLMRSDTRDRIPVPGPRASIGRSNSNAVIISDGSVSRVHATLHRNRDGGFSLTDMDSLNGTFVNDKKITGTAAVKPGDIVGFGTVRASLIVTS